MDESTAAQVESPPRSSDKSRARGILPWAIAAVAALVAVIAIVAFVINEASEPRPVAQLPLQSDAVADDVPVDVETIADWHVGDADFVYYGSYGQAELWSTNSLEDRRCLAVVVQGDTWMFRCTPPTMDTIAVIDAPAPVVPPAPSGEPAGVVQFVLHDDVVDVYLAPRPEGGYY